MDTKGSYSLVGEDVPFEFRGWSVRVACAQSYLGISVPEVGSSLLLIIKGLLGIFTNTYAVLEQDAHLELGG